MIALNAENPFVLRGDFHLCLGVLLGYCPVKDLCRHIPFAAMTDVVAQAGFAKQHITELKTNIKHIQIMHCAVK